MKINRGRKDSQGYKLPEGMTLGQAVLHGMRDEVFVEVQTVNETSTKNSFRKYTQNPIGFVKEVLKKKITDDVRDMLLSLRDNPITFARSANGVGKTNGAAAAIVWFYKAHSGQGVEVYTAAAPPEENLKTLLWGEIRALVSRNPALFITDDVRFGSLTINHGEDWIRGVVIPQAGDPAIKKAKFSGKHAPFLLFVIDEGDAIPPEIYEAIDSCMSGGHARLLVLFNPRAQSGPLYQKEKLGEANVVVLSAFSHVNVMTGFDIIPGAVTREVTCRRISQWTRPLIDGEKIDKSCYIVPQFLVGYRAKKLDGKTFFPAISPGFRKITEPAFAYMVLGEYSSQAEDQLINRDDVIAAQERWKANNGYAKRFSKHRPKIGLDVAELGDDSNVATPRYGDFVDEQIVWAGVDTLVTATRGADLYHLLEAEGAYVDANGLGAGVWPTMRDRGCVAHRIMVTESPTKKAEISGEAVGEFYRLRDQGWWVMREWIRTNPNCMIPDDEELLDELCAATYSRLNGEIKICDNEVMKKRLNGRSPDKASSLMLTFCPDNDDSGASELESNEY